MKNFLMIIFLAESLQIGIGQEIEEENQKRLGIHEIGLNIGGFLTQFIPGNTNSLAQSPYLVSYNLRISNKLFIRSGIGGSFQNASRLETSQTTPRLNSAYSVDARIGIEKRSTLSNRWEMHYGADVVFNNSYSDTNTNNDFGQVKIFDSSVSYGLGPVVGVRYHLNDRIAFGTEGNLYFNYINQVNETQFGSTTFNFKVEETFYTLNFNSPVSVYFIMTF